MTRRQQGVTLSAELAIPAANARAIFSLSPSPVPTLLATPLQRLYSGADL